MQKTKAQSASLRDVLNEIRALRREVSALMPLETIGGYAHPKRIIASYKRALAVHPRYAGHTDR
ncbi:hypothetical protein HYR65_01210 [Candidatus Azambacteria bacterium]|nr:hypothetical protein [Candidatus Azambacteria bacterium]